MPVVRETMIPGKQLRPACECASCRDHRLLLHAESRSLGQCDTTPEVRCMQRKICSAAQATLNVQLQTHVYTLNLMQTHVYRPQTG